MKYKKNDILYNATLDEIYHVMDAIPNYYDYGVGVCEEYLIDADRSIYGQGILFYQFSGDINDHWYVTKIGEL